MGAHLAPEDAGVGLAAVLDDNDYCTAAWACRAGHRGASEAIVSEIEACLFPEIDEHREMLLAAVRAWGAGDDQHAAGAVVAYHAARAEEGRPL